MSRERIQRHSSDVSDPGAAQVNSHALTTESSRLPGSFITPIGAASDAQILAQVKAALDQSGYEQLRGVLTFCHHGRIVLQGRISTYYLKQVAQELVRNVSTVRDVDNDLRVVCSR